jgi:hypothetical protein
MRPTHRSDCTDRCNGDWCRCPCHIADGDEPDLAAEYERMRRARLEGATEGGEAIETP